MSNNQGTRKTPLKISSFGMTADRFTLDDEGVMLTIAMGDPVLIFRFRRFFLLKMNN